MRDKGVNSPDPCSLERCGPLTRKCIIARSLKMTLIPGRRVALLLLVGAFFGVDAPAARAHGGAYRGPVFPPYGAPAGTKVGRTTPGRNPRATTPSHDVRLWETWWGYNKEEFLPQRGRNVGQPGEAGYDAQHHGPNEKQVRESILPILIQLVREERDTDIRDSATLAIGRVGDIGRFGDYRF